MSLTSPPAPPGSPAQAHLTLKEVASRYRVTEYTVRIWGEKDPKFHRPFRCGGVKGKLLWRLADLEAYERQAMRGPTDAA